MPNSNRQPEAIQKAGHGVGGVPEERLTEVPGIGLDTRVQDWPGVRKVEKDRPGAAACPRCGHKAKWLHGFSGNACCPQCKHQWRKFTEEPNEWDGEPFVSIWKLLLIALVILFFTVPIILWRESDRVEQEALRGQLRARPAAGGN